MGGCPALPALAFWQRDCYLRNPPKMLYKGRLSGRMQLREGCKRNLGSVMEKQRLIAEIAIVGLLVFGVAWWMWPAAPGRSPEELHRLAVRGGNR